MPWVEHDIRVSVAMVNSSVTRTNSPLKDVAIDTAVDIVMTTHSAADDLTLIDPVTNIEEAERQPENILPPRGSLRQQSPVRLPRTLHIYSDKAVSSSSGHIKDADRSTTLYTFEVQTWARPNITLRSGSGGQEVGTADFDSLSSKVNLVCHQQEMQSEIVGSTKKWRRYTSPSLNGQELRWGIDDNGRDLLCKDDSERTKATFENADRSLRKLGRLKLRDAVFVADGRIRDELVLNAIVAILEMRRNRAGFAGAEAA